MIIKYPQKEDYDSRAVNDFLMNLGCNSVTIIRSKNQLIIEVDKSLTAAQKTALYSELDKYDLSKTKVQEEIEKK